MGKIGRGCKRVKNEKGIHRLWKMSSSSVSSPLQTQELAFHVPTESVIAGSHRWAEIGNRSAQP